MDKIALETLTPIILDDEQKEKLNYSNYETILDDIMSSDKFSNIALTGAYGAGKSTILNTYEKEHDYKTIHISLAKLNDNEPENVQAKLINQIIHQINPKLIPQTRFKIKNIVGRTKVAFIAILLFAFLTSVIYLFTVPQSQLLEDSKVSLYDTFWQYKGNIVMLGTALLSFLLLLWIVVNAQLKKPLIKSIHMDKSQIELVESENQKKDEEEKFDKYMDEIIYLFEKSRIDILVIEDLDRLEDVKIFYELRQINYLINRKPKKSKKKRMIRFIYMVRDELFAKSEERTKFFDVIVPIVPVMDNSNSYDLLKKMMGEEWLNKLDKAYLKMICMYIHDYRILKNIYNEFQIYYSQLRIEKYRYVPMKLFAIVTYKNLWPKDFADLQQGKGTVYAALKKVDEIRKELIDEIEAEIKGLQLEIAAMQTEVAHDLDELDALYFEKILYKRDDSPGFYAVDGEYEHTFDSRVAFIRALKDSSRVTWYRQGYSTTPVSVSKDEIDEGFEALNNNEEYATRKKRILEYEEHGTAGIEQKIQEQRERQEHVKEAGFKELTLGGVPESFSSLFPSDQELIKIFVQDEMIAEDYASYMTYFYPYSISSDELCYLNKVYARTEDEEQEEIEISHPELVMGYIKSEDWDSIALPNKSLFRYLVQTKNENLPRAIHNLKMHKNQRFAVQMIRELESEENLSAWVNELVEQWADIIELLINGSVLAQRDVFDIVLLILENLDAKKVPVEVVNSYLHSIETVLAERCNPRIVSILEKVGYKFRNVAKISDAMRESIYSLNLYRINRENVEFFIQSEYDIKSDEDISTGNYSAIMSKEDAPLAQYVTNNLDIYVSQVYVPFFAKQSKEAEAILNLLNHWEVSLESKLGLVQAMNMIVEDIDRVDEEEVKQEIVKHKKMAFSKTNILSVWKETEAVSDELYEFLKLFYSSGNCQLTFAYAKKYFNETNEEHPKAVKFISQLLHLEEMGDAYKNLVKDVNIQYTSLTSITWNEEQMKDIVGSSIIFMTEKNLLLMRKQENEDIFFMWITNQMQKYLKLMEKEELREEKELQKLITLDEVSDHEKIECIRMCTSKIQVRETYNTAVVEAIFENDLFDGNFIPVIRRYKSNRYGKQITANLGAYMVTYISNVITMHFALPPELLSYIMTNSSVTIANKKRLLATQTMYHSFEEIQECLKLCGAKAFLDAFDGQNPKVDATEENRLLLEALIKREWLSSFKAIEEKYIIYPKKAIKQDKQIL